MYKVLIEDQEIIVTKDDLKDLDLSYNQESDTFHVLKDGISYKITTPTNEYGKSQELQINHWNMEVKIMDTLDQQIDSMGLSTVEESKSKNIIAPMPGLILDLMCKEGDEIEEGESLLILEAMKMENVIKAEGSGTIGKIHKVIGNTVEKGQLIIEIQ